MYTTLGERITHFRTMRHMTQEQLSERVGVSRQAISKWERGEANPDLYNVQALARALGVRIDDLVSGIEDTREPRQERRPRPEPIQNSNGTNGNYVKQLLYKAKHTTNSEEAARIKKKLIWIGLIGIVLSGSMSIGGFIGFLTNGFTSVNTFGGIDRMFFLRPILFMLMFMGGGVMLMISVPILFAGLTIKVAEVTTNYLDTRETCPSCGDERDTDEKVCSRCGYRFEEDQSICSSCGKDNKPDDVYCRECGQLL